MRLTDLPTIARDMLPTAIKVQIPPSSDTDIVEEMIAIGAGLSAAAAVMWIMSHPDAPIASAGMERTERGAELAMEMMERLSSNIDDMTTEQIEAAANVLKVLAPLGLLRG